MARRALNLSAGIPEIRPIGRLPAGVSPSPFAESQEVDLKPWLLAAGLLLLLVDLGIALALRGLLPTVRTARLGTAHLGAIAFCLFLPMAALAQAGAQDGRSEEHTSELQSLMRI